jgi:hypothetical protein
MYDRRCMLVGLECIKHYEIEIYIFEPFSYVVVSE